MTVEELQIIISAKTENVQAKIDKVKEKIAGLQPKKEAAVNVTTGKAQGNLKKLQTEISRTQAKIDKLNEKMAGVYAKQDTIVGKYAGMPNLTGVPQDKSLDYMVGNDPQMQELNAQLERLEAETTPLKARLAETKAQIASAGNAAEPAAAKTRTLGNSMKTAGKRIQSAGKSSGYFGRMVRHMLVSMLLYKGVEFIFQSISEGLQNMALGSSQANSTMSQIASSALYLKNSIASALMPVLQALTPVITQVADALANVFNTIGMLTARIFNNSSTVTIAKKSNVNYAATLSSTSDKAKDAAKSIKELQRTVMGFDELNVLDKQSVSAESTPTSSLGSGGTPSAKSMFETVKVPSWVEKVGKVTDKIKEKWGEIKKRLEKSSNDISDFFLKTGIGMFALGAILTFSGTKPGIGIALMLSGITITAVSLDWGSMNEKVKHAAEGISIGMFALGAILTFCGKPELGIPLMLMGISIAAASVDWNATGNNVKSAYDTIKGYLPLAGAGLFVFGAILTLAGHIGIGIPLMLAGITVTAVTTDWGALGNNVKSTYDKVKGYLPLVGIGLAVLGVVLCLCGILPFGIPMLIGGLAITAVTTDWNYVGNKVKGAWGSIVAWYNKDVAPWFTKEKWENIGKGAVNGLISVFEKGINWIIDKLDTISWTVPSWVGGIGGKTYGIQIPEISIPRLAAGGLLTKPTLMVGGEGIDDEAVLPLNENSFSQIAQGIAEKGDNNVSDESLEILHSIDESLKQGHSINLRMDVDGKPFVQKVIKEVNNRNRRYSPTATI